MLTTLFHRFLFLSTDRESTLTSAISEFSLMPVTPSRGLNTAKRPSFSQTLVFSTIWQMAVRLKAPFTRSLLAYLFPLWISKVKLSTFWAPRAVSKRGGRRHRQVALLNSTHRPNGHQAYCQFLGSIAHTGAEKQAASDSATVKRKWWRSKTRFSFVWTQEARLEAPTLT